MIGALVGFELTRRLKVVSTYVYAVLLFAAGFFMMLASGGVFRSIAVSSSSDRVMANSPHALFGMIGIIALFGVFTVAAIFGQAAYQDFGHGTWMIIFTKNVKKGPYLVGRFLGAFVFSAGLFLAIGAGQAAGSIVVHFVHPESLGPTSVLGYLWPFVVQVWPMLFFTGALFFTLAAVTRRMAPVYVGAVVLILGYLVASALLKDVENRVSAALLDPFGFLAFGIVTRYWTPAEQNHDLVSVLGLYGVNRLLWAVVGVAMLGAAIRAFRTTVDEHRGRGAVDDERSRAATPFPTVIASATTFGWWRAVFGFSAMYFREVVRSGVYWAFVSSGVLLVTLIVLVSKEIFGTATLPVTYQALEQARGGFGLFTIIIVTFYAGELVWRERDVGVQDVFDATPMPSWVGFLAKIGALLLVALSIEGAVAIVALISQVARGYFAIEPKLYVTELILIDFTGTALLCVLALVVQVLVNHKYLGHAMMVLYYIANAVLRALGFEDKLLRFKSEPSTTYSDMNGYGHLLGPWRWYRLYWWSFALLLIVLGYVFFVRGRETKLRARFAAGRRRLGPAWRVVAALGLMCFAGAGSFIFYNTHILHRYRNSKNSERDQATYEKTYKTFASTPQPRIVGAELSVDIFPEERRLVAVGTYRIANKGTEPVTGVMIDLPETANVRALRIGDAKESQPTDFEKQVGLHFFDLAKPLAAGEEADLTYDLEYSPKGFTNGEPRTAIVGNGTFVNNGLLPTIGYQKNQELDNDGDRKSYGLAPKERMAARDDPKELQHNYIRQDSDFITFAITVSTSADQTAIAPGYLEKEWTANGRRYFRYVMDHPILNFFSVLSARYATKRDEWNGVKLEIHYHPGHTANLDRMIAGMKDSLAYCSDAFGPYQHRQVRILEFPRYQQFAQSFPNTIPYSESIGFIALVRDDDPDDVDYPYYVTAHEVAHQWWAHQIVGANVRGATMTSESMAQYSALMVMKKKYGEARMRRFLKFELDRYLTGRVAERKKELPLAHNENQQYIHYNKGSVAMYALQDFIGEERVNRALKKVVTRMKFQGPPYATSKDLLDAFREETPPEYQYLIEDLFETITLYDNRAVSATATQNASGAWDIALKVTSRKVRSDDKGTETELEFDDYMDVGGLDAKGIALHIEKRKVKKGPSEIRFTMPSKPAKVGIDPLNKLIDRASNDNVTVPN